MQTQKLPLLSMMVLMCAVGAIPPHSSPAAPQQAKAAPAISEPAKTMAAATSAPLLSSPLLSLAAKAQMQNEQMREDEAYPLVKSGDEAAKTGDWLVAENDYRQALDVSPAHGLGCRLALYGLIACCRATGDTARGLEYSRQAIYHHGSAAEGFFENDAEKLMPFVLLLNKTGQSAEAMSVYNRAAYLLDYEDSENHGGKPTLKVLLPEVAMEPTSAEQVPYTPERLQALADTALAHEEMGFGSNAEAITHMKEAAKLYPDSAAIQYYLGDALSRSYYIYLDSAAKDKAAAWAACQEDKKAAAVAYKKAAELGNDQTVAAAKERLAAPR